MFSGENKKSFSAKKKTFAIRGAVWNKSKNLIAGMSNYLNDIGRKYRERCQSCADTASPTSDIWVI